MWSLDCNPKPSSPVFFLQSRPRLSPTSSGDSTTGPLSNTEKVTKFLKTGHLHKLGPFQAPSSRLSRDSRDSIGSRWTGSSSGASDVRRCYSSFLLLTTVLAWLSQSSSLEPSWAHEYTQDAWGSHASFHSRLQCLALVSAFNHINNLSLLLSQLLSYWLSLMSI